MIMPKKYYLDCQTSNSKFLEFCAKLLIVCYAKNMNWTKLKQDQVVGINK